MFYCFAGGITACSPGTRSVIKEIGKSLVQTRDHKHVTRITRNKAIRSLFRKGVTLYELTSFRRIVAVTTPKVEVKLPMHRIYTPGHVERIQCLFKFGCFAYEKLNSQVIKKARWCGKIIFILAANVACFQQ